MKKLIIIGNYIETHAWAQWVVTALMFFAFFAAVDYGYSAIHDGEEFADAALDWLGCPR